MTIYLEHQPAGDENRNPLLQNLYILDPKLPIYSINAIASTVNKCLEIMTVL